MTSSRSKMVSFRLSLEEYESYREACASIGVRSISELAREALSQLVGARPNGNATTLSQPVSLRDRINFLSREVEWLASRMDQITPTAKARTTQDRPSSASADPDPSARLRKNEPAKSAAAATGNGLYGHCDQE
jgi:hypothetical protein